jgi:hypothetical protein
MIIEELVKRKGGNERTAMEKRDFHPVLLGYERDECHC